MTACLRRPAALVLACLALAACGGGEGGGGTTTTAPPTDAACAPPRDGFRPLFDGSQESLDAWRMAGPGGFELRGECAMVTVGGMGLLWFPEELDGYRLRLDWRAEGEGNSGIFVGFPDPGADPWIAVREGLEVQIDPSDEPEQTTGAIYGVQGADLEARDAALRPPGEWNTYEIVADGPRMTVHLNGVLVNDFTSETPGSAPGVGHVGLQNHGPADRVYFRHVRISDS